MSSQVFNRVLGLKFLYENFPYYYDNSKIKLFFVNNKQSLLSLDIKDQYDTILLKRSANKKFINDINFKDNRFFKTITDLKNGINEFDDVFDFCVECHKFKEGESYYSDKLAIAQFSTKQLTDATDIVSFIPAYVPGINTRENASYIEIEYPNDYTSIFHINKYNEKIAQENHFDTYTINYLANKIHAMIDDIREYILELNIQNNFQLIIRIDSYLNLLPIDFRTPDAWAKI